MSSKTGIRRCAAGALSLALLVSSPPHAVATTTMARFMPSSPRYSCTNSCTVNAINPDFNPRFWIYLIRMGMESELLRDKDIIWQCVSCNKCTYACPRDVFPEGVMKATAHWLELQGHTPKSRSTLFDEEFSEQVVATGKIEDGRVIRNFFAKTGQPLMQDWLVEMVKRVARRLPFRQGIAMAFATVFQPRTRKWSKARAALGEYVHEQEARHRKALSLPNRSNGDIH